MTAIIEDAFEPFWGSFSCFDRTSVVDLIDECSRAINRAETRRLAWIATRHDQVYDEWAATAHESTASMRRFTDELDQVVAEVGAVIGRGPTAARNAIELALTLRDRTPAVFELLYEGLVSKTVARTIARRAEAVTDPALLHRYDAAVSEQLARKLARGRAVVTENDAKRLADGVLAKLDPAAIPPARTAQRRGVWFDKRRDGLTEFAGVTFCEDAADVERQIERVANTVCRKDPRTMGERRADAHSALIQGYDSLGCRCETPGCDHAERIPRHATVEAKTIADVTMVMNESTLAGIDDEPVLIDGNPTAAGVGRDLLARVGTAWFRPLGKPVDGERRVIAHDVAGYRPSDQQARFLRVRYPTCVFPGCQTPFSRCQIDHVAERNHRDPGLGGATAIGNLVPLCGRHHRIKTEQDWLSDVLPDGTVEWHAPTGHSYRTAQVQGDDWFPDLERIRWLPPTRPLPTPADTAPGRAEVRNAAREARRREYRREREQQHREHPNTPAPDDPPPF
ncbi:HNH endonuclease signature motif containing protein [Tsukamurella sp. 1534]|uniref:HNH endonuclease signature motif containing protein n=1 Tax=Tsukamurella sp. 1534 TaxID=1151061 RepID=UPI0002DCDC5C|nr:HNH endonuclease signature motif containing protein [Tsukamurella sp. 1534]